MRVVTSSLLAVLLTGSVWLSRCVSCRTPGSEEPVHDCCRKGSCHRDSGQEPAGKRCPHQSPALEQYAQADPAAAAVVAAVPFQAGFEPAAPSLPAHTSAVLKWVAHSPPDLYLHNSVLLI